MARRLFPAPAAGIVRGLLAVAFLCMPAMAGTASAQVRVGVAIGGASVIAGLVEYRWQHQGVELQIGTIPIGGRNVSISVTAKQYMKARRLEPYVGAGLWWLVAMDDRGVGHALVARLPVGLDWNLSSRQALGSALHFNRVLGVRRPDPTDTRPATTAVVPLPEILSYRWFPREKQ